MAKLVDVARLAGVSAGTASRVISGKGNVSAELVAAVERAVEELNYRPNMLARSLRRNRTQTFGLVVPDITNPFFAELALSVEIAAAERGYSLILGNSRNLGAAQDEYVQNLLDRQIDGLVLVPADEDRPLPVAARATPLVVLDRDIKAPGADFVGTDHEEGARQMVRYLASLGHRVIGCITTPPGELVGDERYAGYVDVAAPLLAAEGLDLDHYVSRGSFSFASGMAAMQELLDRSPRPTAVFASNDQQAIGAMRHCQDVGISVPDEMSIAGYDDVPLASLVSPRLTTVRQPIESIGAQAVQWLTERSGEERPRRRRTRRLQPLLEIRGSCSAVPPRTA
jgi:LacI family transcriptional regulator